MTSDVALVENTALVGKKFKQKPYRQSLDSLRTGGQIAVEYAKLARDMQGQDVRSTVSYQ
jgi:hypothetical protein